MGVRSTARLERPLVLNSQLQNRCRALGEFE